MKLRVRLEPQLQEYDIRIGRGLLQKVGREARNCTSKSSRAAIISNPRVFYLYGSPVADNLRQQKFRVSHWLMPEGERYKSLRTLERALTFLSESGLERNDVVIALGGGVVGDLAGFAAAAYLRGVAFIQVPTTLLAQIDSSVGGKTGVNLPTGKNLVGAFHQPSAVIIDTETLATLPRRELTAGWCEAVKTGAIAGLSLFQQTREFLGQLSSNRNLLRSRQLESLIGAQCAFKVSIVAGDERERLDRADRSSRRILNFGHTAGHALEAITRYRRFRHGEAVGHGLLIAGEISKNLGLLAPSELELLRDAVRLCGPLPSAKDLSEQAIIDAIGHDKKRIGGRLQWVLLEGIGRPRLIDNRTVEPRLLRASLRAVLRDGN